MNGGFVGTKQRMLLSCKWLSGLYNAGEKSTLKITLCRKTETHLEFIGNINGQVCVT